MFFLFLSPSSDAKTKLAKTIVTVFPSMKNPKGLGYVSSAHSNFISPSKMNKCELAKCHWQKITLRNLGCQLQTCKIVPAPIFW